MKKIKVGINGMGRIGRTLIREVLKRSENASLEIVAVNNPGDAKEYAHLIKYDSLYGPLNRDLSLEASTNLSVLKIGSSSMTFYGEREPAKIPWENHGVEVVIDATGVFRDHVSLSKHLKGSVKKVILCAPGKELDGTFVMGINHQNFDPSNHHIISNASCTTNCLAPVAKVLQDTFGIESGFMTTIHSYTSDQNLLDNSHKDLRRARAAALSMIPTSTGAAKAVGQVLPELSGKLDGYAVRVPTPNVSLVDLNVTLQKAVGSVDEINQALKKASENDLKGILAISNEQLVSSDYIANPYSSIVDASLTNLIGQTAKIVAWYDNETGFSNRVLDLATYIGQKSL